MLVESPSLHDVILEQAGLGPVQPSVLSFESLPGEPRSSLFLPVVLAIALGSSACGGIVNAPIPPQSTRIAVPITQAPQMEVSESGTQMLAYTPEEFAQVRPILEDIAANAPEGSVEKYMASKVLGRETDRVFIYGIEVILKDPVLHKQPGNVYGESYYVYDSKTKTATVSGIIVPVLGTPGEFANIDTPEKWKFFFLKEAAGNVVARIEIGDIYQFILNHRETLPSGVPIPPNVDPDIEALRTLPEWIDNPKLREQHRRMLDRVINEFFLFIDARAAMYFAPIWNRAFPDKQPMQLAYLGEPITTDSVLAASYQVFLGNVGGHLQEQGLPNLLWLMGIAKKS